ncbi:phosphopantetheine-binding protein [Parenemella sanctibonifatiensis]
MDQPRGTYEYDVQRIVCRLTERPSADVGVTASMEDIGLDSVDFMVLLAELGRATGAPLLGLGLDPRSTSCASLAERVVAATGAMVPPGLLVFSTRIEDNASIIWVVLPAGNGEVGFARRSLLDWDGVLGLRGYGLGPNELVPDSGAALGQVYWKAVEDLVLERPDRRVVFVGFSLGAWIARLVAEAAHGCVDSGSIGLVLMDPLPPSAYLRGSEAEFLDQRRRVWERYTVGRGASRSWPEVSRLAIKRGALPGYLGGDDLRRIELFQFRTARAAMTEAPPLPAHSLLISSRGSWRGHWGDPTYEGSKRLVFPGGHAELTWGFPWRELRSYGHGWNWRPLAAAFERGRTHD